MRSSFIALAAILALAPSPLLAQPFAADDPDFGTGSITVEPLQGLEFLDLTVTEGLSQATLATQLLPGGVFEDWRYATPEEVATLLNEIGWSPPITSVFASNTTSTDVARRVTDFIGVSEVFPPTASRASYGLLSDGRTIAVRFEDVFGLFTSSEVSEVLDPSDQLLQLAGHWLVRKTEDRAPTYQGRLTDMGTPFDGQADFRLTLVSSSGSVLATIEQTGVPVEQGLFTVPLSFDAQSLGSRGVTLRIETRAPAGDGAFEMLVTDQPIAPTPRALRSLSAEAADFAFNADVALALSNEAIVALPLAAGTEPYGRGYRSPVVTRSGKLVVLNGLVGDIGIPNDPGTVFATLPAGFRPSARLLFLQASSAGIYRVDVLPNGEIQFLDAPGVGGNIDWISLDGISFPIE